MCGDDNAQCCSYTTSCQSAGITVSNKPIFTDKPFTITYSSGSGVVEIWAKYVLVEVPETNPDGKSVTVINSPSTETTNIVIDEQAAAILDIDPSEIFNIGDPLIDDAVLIGKIDTDTQEVVEMNPDMGFGFDQDGYRRIVNLLSTTIKSTTIEADDITANTTLTTEESSTQEVKGTFDLKATSNVISNSEAGIDADLNFVDDTGKTVSLKFNKGICVNFTIV